MKTKKSTIEKSEPIKQKSFQPIDFQAECSVFTAADLGIPSYNNISAHYPFLNTISSHNDVVIALSKFASHNHKFQQKLSSNNAPTVAKFYALAIEEMAVSKNLIPVPFTVVLKFDIKNKTAEYIQRKTADQLKKSLKRKVDFIFTLEQESEKHILHNHIHGVILLEPSELKPVKKDMPSAFHQAFYDLNKEKPNNHTCHVHLNKRNELMTTNGFYSTVLNWQSYGLKNYSIRIYKNKLPNKYHHFVVAIRDVIKRANKLYNDTYRFRKDLIKFDQQLSLAALERLLAEEAPTKPKSSKTGTQFVSRTFGKIKFDDDIDGFIKDYKNALDSMKSLSAMPIPTKSTKRALIEASHIRQAKEFISGDTYGIMAKSFTRTLLKQKVFQTCEWDLPEHEQSYYLKKRKGGDVPYAVVKPNVIETIADELWLLIERPSAANDGELLKMVA